MQGEREEDEEINFFSGLKDNTDIGEERELSNLCRRFNDLPLFRFKCVSLVVGL
jgi:hypothetical protein